MTTNKYISNEIVKYWDETYESFNGMEVIAPTTYRSELKTTIWDFFNNLSSTDGMEQMHIDILLKNGNYLSFYFDDISDVVDNDNYSITFHHDGETYNTTKLSTQAVLCADVYGLLLKRSLFTKKEIDSLKKRYQH